MSLAYSLDELRTAFPISDASMPALFVGHGSPMNALEDNAFTRAWARAIQAIPRPSAILCVSAHWETSGTLVTGMDTPRTIHDFGGFPRALFQKQYPAPGSPALAHLTQETIHQAGVRIDHTWGLDHGAWSVLCRMFPDSDIPVVQLSLDRTQPPEYHYALAQELRTLRQRGVLILGSGNIVHNLRMTVFDDALQYDWALEFDQTASQLITSGNHQALVNYQALGSAARLAIPTNEHYLPLLYVLALQREQDAVSFFADQVTYGAISMRSVRIG